MYFSLSPSTSSATSSYSTSPMEIPSGNAHSSATSPSCAFPSWPRRSSLSSNSSTSEEYHSSSSFISDEDLFPCVFDEAEQDITPPVTPYSHRSPASPSRVYNAQIAHENGALMRQLVADEKAKKERRRRRSSSSKKSRSGSGASKHMSPIQEAVE